VLVETSVAPSVQLTNEYPELGVAVTVTEVPELNVPPPLTIPPATGLAVTPTVKSCPWIFKRAENNIKAMARNFLIM
jgi:hypothetical protein